MTYAAFVDEEYAGDVGTLSGWSALMEWVEAHSPEGSELRNLADLGWSQEVSTLQQEVAAMNLNDPQLEGVRQALAQSIERGGHIIVINDGT